MIGKTIDLKQALCVFSVVWVVVTSGGVFFISEDIVRLTLLFNVFLVFLQFLVIGKRFYLRRGIELAVYFFLVLFVVISVILNSDYESWLTYARLLVVVAVALGTSVLVSNRVFAVCFVKTIFFLSVVSLGFYYLEIVDNYPQFFSILDFHDKRYHNAFVYLSLDGIDNRNLGIFIEPGLFQIYINIAVFFVLYGNYFSKYKFLVVCVLLAALYSTNSTTGLIVGLVLLAGHAVVNIFSGRLSFGAIANVAIAFSVVSLVFVSDFFSDNLESKFKGDNQKSYVTRQNSTLIDLMIVSDNLLSGGGAGRYQESIDKFDSSGLEVDAATNTFTQLGAIVGMPFLLLVLFRSVRYFFGLSFGLLPRLLIVVVYIVSFSTEPFVLYPFFYIPVFMSSFGNMKDERRYSIVRLLTRRKRALGA